MGSENSGIKPKKALVDMTGGGAYNLSITELSYDSTLITSKSSGDRGERER